jgi:outer membrane protein assembly factor BamB
VCLALKTGEQLWRVPGGTGAANKGGDSRTGWLAQVSQTLLIHEGVVLVLQRDLSAFSLENGKLLWKSAGGKGSGGLGSPPDLFVADGLVWPGEGLQGHDLLTGQVKRDIDIMHLLSQGHHPRCYRSKATDSYLIMPKRGAEFVDLQAGSSHMRHDWLRGPCRYGILPCNGLIYAPPHQCNCYPGVKLTGFNALAAQRSPPTGDRQSGPRLERGPAYRQMQNPSSGSADPHDWPTYRYDYARSGSVKSPLPTNIAPLWQAKLGGKLSQPVVAEGRLLVAEVETHRVLCLDANEGKPLWSFVAGGRVDGPPSVYRGLALFGSADGYVYCVRISDGALVWRFRAAPEPRRVVAFGELESAWPVHGSVLIQNDVAYVNAGRSTFLDGGIYVYALDPVTGGLLHEDHLEGPYPDITKPEGTAWNMDGATSEVLVGDGEFIYLRQVKWDGGLVRQPTPLVTERGRNVGGGAKQVGQHLYATSDLLDDSGFNRVYWTYSDVWSGRCKNLPGAAQLLVFDSKTTYGAMPFTARTAGMPGFFPASGCVRLFASANNREPPTTSRKARRLAAASPASGEWSVTVPVLVRAMLLADEILYITGPPDVLDPADPLAALEGREGSMLWVVSTADGTKVSEQLLPSVPVFDGLAAAQGRLYLSTTDGTVICLSAGH